jgi:hypothetical protein
MARTTGLTSGPIGETDDADLRLEPAEVGRVVVFNARP